MIATAAGLTPVPAFAAQQGVMGAASKGEATISASVAARTDMIGVQDARLAAAPGLAMAMASQRVCIRSNSPTGGYDLMAAGAAKDGAFVLSAGNGATYSILLTWTDAVTGSRGLLPDVPLRGVASRAAGCSPVLSSTLTVVAPATGAVAVGAVTLTISPL